MLYVPRSIDLCLRYLLNYFWTFPKDLNLMITIHQVYVLHLTAAVL